MIQWQCLMLLSLSSCNRKPYYRLRNLTPSERKKVIKVLDFDNLYDVTDDDLIDAAEAAFDEYLAECTADYSEACRIRAHKRS